MLEKVREISSRKEAFKAVLDCVMADVLVGAAALERVENAATPVRLVDVLRRAEHKTIIVRLLLPFPMRILNIRGSWFLPNCSLHQLFLPNMAGDDIDDDSERALLIDNG
jgi:hypothetical protein